MAAARRDGGAERAKGRSRAQKARQSKKFWESEEGRAAKRRYYAPRNEQLFRNRRIREDIAYEKYVREHGEPEAYGGPHGGGYVSPKEANKFRHRRQEEEDTLKAGFSARNTGFQPSLREDMKGARLKSPSRAFGTRTEWTKAKGGRKTKPNNKKAVIDRPKKKQTSQKRQASKKTPNSRQRRSY